MDAKRKPRIDARTGASTRAPAVKERVPEHDVAALSRRLHEALLADQKKARAPEGHLKCPTCGAPVEPTKNGRIRTHDADPYDQLRCPASGKPWKEFGAEPKAAKAGPARPAKSAKKRSRTRAKR